MAPTPIMADTERNIQGIVSEFGTAQFVFCVDIFGKLLFVAGLTSIDPCN